MCLLWNRHEKLVHQESCLFLEGEASPLRFPAQEILSVKCPILGVEYREGKDYLLSQGGAALVRPPGSGMPVLPRSALILSAEEAKPYPHPEANAVEGGRGGTFLRFSNQDFFARHQVEVTYRAKEIPLPPPSWLAPGRLPPCRPAAARRKALSATFIGDSITEGYNATEFIHQPPFLPPYPGLMAREWGKKGVHFRFQNRAIGGTEARQAMELKDKWREDQPQLLVIAYGMNDLYAFQPQAFLESLAQIQEDCRKASPHTEYLLVIPMRGNPDWKYTPLLPPIPPRAAVRPHAATPPPATAPLDVFQLWEFMLHGKRFHDLTGNGVNHPNDFGHRIYAAALLNFLAPEAFPL